jgi:hypothetical protein
MNKTPERLSNPAMHQTADERNNEDAYTVL